MGHSEAIRLQLRLARAGIASRRKCETFIAEGRVKVNGRIVITPGSKVTPEDEVIFDGRPVRDEKRKIYIHPALAYGTSGELPPNALLTFEVEVIKADAVPDVDLRQHRLRRSPV